MTAEEQINQTTESERWRRKLITIVVMVIISLVFMLVVLVNSNPETNSVPENPCTVGYENYTECR